VADYYLDTDSQKPVTRLTGSTTFNFTSNVTGSSTVIHNGNSVGIPITADQRLKVVSAKLILGFEQTNDASYNGRFGFNFALTTATGTSDDPLKYNTANIAVSSQQFDVRFYSSPDQIFMADRGAGFASSPLMMMTGNGGVLRGGVEGDELRLYVKGYRDSANIIPNGTDVYVTYEIEFESA